MIVTKRRHAPRAQNYRTGVWSGLGSINSQGGWNPDPVPPPAQYESCSAVDSACTARNLALNIAHESAMAIALYGHDGAGGGPLGYLDLGGTAPTPSIASGPVAPVNQVTVQSGQVNPIESRNTGRVVSPGVVDTPVTSPGSVQVEPASVPVTPDGSVIVTSSGTQAAPAPAPSVAVAASSFDFSAVPWYVWAGGAVAALYLMGGHSGR